MQYKHIPVVLAGMDTKTNEKDSILGALKLALNMFMQKTKKWRSRYGYSQLGTTTSTTAIGMGTDSKQTFVLEPSNIINIGNNNSVTTAISRNIWSVDNFYSASLNNKCLQFIGSANNYVLFDDLGNTATVYVNNKLAYVYFTSPNPRTLISTTYITGYSQYMFSHSTDATNYAFICNTAGTTAYAFSNTAVLTKAHAVSGGTLHPKTAGLFTGEKSYCITVYRTAGSDVKCWIWNVTDDTTTAEITVGTMGFEVGGDIWAISGCVQGCSDGKFHIGIPQVGTNTWNLVTLTVAGAGASPGSKVIDAGIVQDFYQLTSVIMTYSGDIYYSGHIIPVGTEPEVFMSDIGGTFFKGYLITSQSSKSVNDLVVISNSSSNSNSAFDAQYLLSFKALRLGLSYGYSQLSIRDGIWDDGSSQAAIIQGVASGILVLNSSILPTFAYWHGQLFTNAAGTLSLLDYKFGDNIIQPAGYASPMVTGLKAETFAGALPSGTYNIFIVPVYQDTSGNFYYGPPTEIVTAVSDGTKAINLYFTGTSLLENPGGDNNSIRLQIVASFNNGLYYVQKTISYSEGPTTLASFNTDIAYTFNGSLLDSGALLPMKNVSTALGRIWAYAANTIDTWVFSTLYNINTGPRFPDGFSITVNSNHGRPVYAAEMDNKVVLFHEYGIFVTWGDGPDETGAGRFSPPQLISQSVGCKYARSVILTDNGLMFMSYEGIYLLDRGLTLFYIGAQVEDLNSLTITGAKNLTDRHQIWFYSQEGSMLCYDEFHKIWSIFSSLPTKATTLINGDPYFIRISDGKILKENKTAFNDSGISYSCRLETQWINLAEVQGYQRMRKLTWSGTASQNGTLTMYRDWSDIQFETFTILPSISPYQFQIKPKIQKSEAIRWDLTYSNIGFIIEVDTFGIEAGMQEGTFRIVPSAQRVKGN